MNDLIKSAENFPSATIAALAEAFVKKDDKRKHTLLVSLLNANPLLVEKLVIGLSSQAANLLQQCQQLLNSRNEDFANSEILPMVLVSPPWETQNKNNDNSPVGKYRRKSPLYRCFINLHYGLARKSKIAARYCQIAHSSTSVKCSASLRKRPCRYCR